VARARKTTRSGVVRAATRIARRDGLDAVTIRAVAASLRVTPMALYHHVGSAEGLRLATVDAILLQVRAPTDGGTPKEQLHSFATQTRDVLARYPGAADTVLTSWPQLGQACRLMEWLLVTAAGATPKKERRVDIANGVFTYILMRVMVERAALAGGRDRSLPAVEAHPERFPRLVEVQRRFAHIDTQRHFRVGLDALLDGLLRTSP
jgi:AcrR family transcriptional regulator